MSDVAAYVRVSTPSQKDERSHLRQRKNIAMWAEMEDYDPGNWEDYHEGDEITGDTEWQSIHGKQTGDITWYEDIAISGTVSARDAHELLLEEYANYDLVVVKNLSRFGRRGPEKDTKEILTMTGYYDEGEAGDVDFVSVEDPFDTTSANGRLMLRQMASYHAWFAERRSEQAEEMIERRRAEGKPIGRPKKLSDDEIEQVHEWRESDLSYGTISVLVKERFDTEVSRETVRRYCQDETAEVA